MKSIPLLSSLFAFGLVTSLLAADENAKPTPAPAKPNIIFILCDDLGCGDVGVFFQNQRAARKNRNVPSFATPQIDSLGHEGVMLTQHYCGAPVCAPSRGSLLTGLTQGHCAIRDNQFDKALPDTLTLGSVLQKAGYATAAIGKWGLQGKAEGAKGKGKKTSPANETPAYPTRRGFDHYFGYVAHRDGHAHYPKEDGNQLWENDREISEDLDLCYTADLFTAHAKKWIVEQKTAKPEQPFFIYLAYDTPHAKCRTLPAPIPQAAASSAASNGPASRTP
jgi:arylsulfatase A-like enzyme